MSLGVGTQVVDMVCGAQGGIQLGKWVGNTCGQNPARPRPPRNKTHRLKDCPKSEEILHFSYGAQTVPLVSICKSKMWDGECVQGTVRSLLEARGDPAVEVTSMPSNRSVDSRIARYSRELPWIQA